MESWSKIIVREENIICSAENFYCAAAEKLSHNIAKRWRMDETTLRKMFGWTN